VVVQPIGKNISQLGSLPQTSKECKEHAMQKNLRIQGIINLVTHNVIFEGNSLALDLYKKGNDSLEVVPPKKHYLTYQTDQTIKWTWCFAGS